MRVLLHSGPGFISRAIKLQTRSPWNHASLLFSDGVVIEAREFKGVVRTPVERILDAIKREPKLRVAVYEFAIPVFSAEEARARAWAESRLGCGYDYSDIVRFISRVPAQDDDSWFCSEFVTAACHVAGRPLFNETKSWEVPPGWIQRSLALAYAGELPSQV